MNARTGLLMAALCVIAVTPETTFAAKAAHSVIVVPARHAYLQVAVDVSRFHETTVIGYRKGQGGSVRLFIWNPASKGWARLSMNQYQSGTVFGPRPSRLILVNTEEQVPAVLHTPGGAIQQTQRLTVDNIGDLVNQLAPIYRFSESEWRKIAEWNHLTLTDRNAERRRWGRWGKPGTASAEPTTTRDMIPAQKMDAEAMPAAESEPMVVTEYDEAAAGDADTTDAPAAPASELPVADVVSSQPETTTVDPANK